ncbi:MAG: acyltransferase family protein [Arthrobacter sp.]
MPWPPMIAMRVMDPLCAKTPRLRRDSAFAPSARLITGSSPIVAWWSHVDRIITSPQIQRWGHMTLSAPAHRSTAAKPKTKRLDIQGLRAVAVLAVIANHMFGFPTGGFVGVDVFFVISGFVITRVMLREHELTGRINFINFYRHRIRRILPASTLTLVATIAVSALIYLPGRVSSVLTDAFWSLLFAGNWRFASSGTDYWAEDTPVSPLQHFWSLGVEEQYYFVWPAVVALVLLIAGLTSVSGRVLLALVLTGVVVLSFAWSVHETSTNPAWAYFSTPARAWELGTGALVALGAAAFTRIPPRLAAVIAWAGLGGIAVSLVAITKEAAFPAPWAALPVLATALVIIAGTSGTSAQPGPLTNKLMCYIGDISYSLYLWHFPVVVLSAELMPERGALFYAVAFSVTAALSILSYHLVEQRVLKSTWLSAAHGETSPQPAHLAFDSRRRRLRLGLFAAVGAGALALGLNLTTGSGFNGPVNTVPLSGAQSAPSPGMKQPELTAHLDAALGSRAWPALKPSVDTILADTRPDEDNDGCGHTDLAKPDCSWDSGKRQTVVVLGDSTGITLLPTVRAALGDTYNVRGMTMAGCSPLDLQVKADKPQFAIDCGEFKADSVRAINHLKPAMVLISSTSEILDDLVSEVPESRAGVEWRQGTINVLRALEPSGARLIVVSAPPLGKPPVECATRFSNPSDCEYTLPQSHVLTAAAMQEATATAGAAFIDTRAWFCSESRCPAFVGETPLKRDSVHTTRQYAVLLAGVLGDAVSAAQR